MSLRQKDGVCNRSHGIPTSLILLSIAAFMIAMPARNCAACSSISDGPMAIFVGPNATKSTTSARADSHPPEGS
jgi:hypothetical protein